MMTSRHMHSRMEKGGMVQPDRDNNDIRRKWDELVSRNQRFALELARLQEVNRVLRIKVTSLMIKKLSVEKDVVDKETQTEDIDRLKVTRRKAHRRSPEFNFKDFRETIQPQLTEYDYVINQSTLDFVCETTSTPRQSTDRVMEKENVILSPSRERVASVLAERIFSPVLPEEATHSATFVSPQIEGVYLEEDASFNDSESVNTPSRRPTRSTRRPTSYQEPQLNVKMRKGFKFFRF